MGVTTRLGLPYPELTDPANVPADMEALADAIDGNMALDLQGTLAARPAADIPGRYYWATDATEKMLTRDDGDAWFNLNRFPDGNAAAPGIVFAKDLDTGFYRPAANQIGFSTAGTPRGIMDAVGGFTWNGNFSLNGSMYVGGDDMLFFQEKGGNAAILAANETGDVAWRFYLTDRGNMLFGGGAAAADINVARISPGVLQMFLGRFDAPNGLSYSAPKMLLSNPTTVGITAGVGTPVFWQTEDYKHPSLHHNPSGKDLIVLDGASGAGWYLVTGFVTFNGTAGGQRWVYITKNAVGVMLGGTSAPANAAGVSLTTTALVHLAEGESVQIAVLHDSGNTPVALTAGYASMTYVGY